MVHACMLVTDMTTAEYTKWGARLQQARGKDLGATARVVLPRAHVGCMVERLCILRPLCQLPRLHGCRTDLGFETRIPDTLLIGLATSAGSHACKDPAITQARCHMQETVHFHSVLGH